MPDETRQTISATQSPALFHVSPYTTLWMLKRHFIYGDALPNPEHNRVDWGQKMQGLLLAQAAEDLHLEVRPNTENTYVRAGLIGCTRDAEIIDPDKGLGSLECKCVFDYGVWMREWDGGKTVPRHIEIQLQHQMMVGDGTCEYHWGVIAVWIAGEMKYFYREGMPELWTEIGREAIRFFEDVEAGNEGDPFGAPIEMPLINRLFAPRQGKIADFTMHERAIELADNVRMLAWHGEERRSHSKGEEQLKAKLRALIGDAEEALFCDGIRVRAKQRNRKAYQVKESSWVELEPFVPDNERATERKTGMLTDLSGG